MSLSGLPPVPGINTTNRCRSSRAIEHHDVGFIEALDRWISRGRSDFVYDETATRPGIVARSGLGEIAASYNDERPQHASEHSL